VTNWLTNKSQLEESLQRNPQFLQYSDIPHVL